MRAKKILISFSVLFGGGFILIYGNACSTNSDAVTGSTICPSGECQATVEIQSVTPSGGPLLGGTVVVGGIGFADDATVKIGNLTCAVSQATSTAITCTLPAATSPMWGDVVVQSNGSDYTLAKGYAFGAAVVGQPNFNSRALALGNSLGEPWGGFAINNLVFIADTQNSRITAYNSGITSSSQSPDWALGQTDLSNGAIPYSNTAASAETFASPRSLCYDGTNLMVLDQGRNRLVIYSGVPSSWSTAPAVVLGQTDFSGTQPNQGNGVPLDASMMDAPESVYCDSQYVVVSDTGNNRLLVWANNQSFTNGQAADYILGQTSTTGYQSNQGATTPTSGTLSGPTGLFFDGAIFYVVDSGNHRILGWNGYPTSGSTPYMELGQSSMTANNAVGCTATTMTDPEGVARLGNFLFVTDRTLNRLMAWDLTASGGVSTWTTNTVSPTILGQPNATSCLANQASGGPVTASGFRNPSGLFIANNSLMIADTGNNRVLAFSATTLGTSGTLNSGPVADFYVGQPTAAGANPDQTVLSSASLKAPQISSVINGSLFVPDSVLNRVLVFTPVPTVNNTSATWVMGQPDFVTAVANSVSDAISSQTLSGARAVFGDSSNNVYVSDAGNNRTLIFNNLTGLSDPAAAAVLGQTSFTVTNTATNPAGLRAPSSGCLSGTTFYQSDTNNHRILVYNNWSISGPSAPTNVIGQNDFSTNSADAPGGGYPTANGLWSPESVSCDNNNHLLVADTGNHRVLIFNLPLTFPAPSAAIVLGQPDFVSNEPNYYLDSSSTYQGGLAPTSTDMCSPHSAVVGDNGKLYVADTHNHRVLIWNTFSTVQTGQAADAVFGQNSMTQYFPNTGAATPTSRTLWSPNGISVYSGRLVISDGGNSRVLIVPEM